MFSRLSNQQVLLSLPIRAIKQVKILCEPDMENKSLDFGSKKLGFTRVKNTIYLSSLLPLQSNILNCFIITMQFKVCSARCEFLKFCLQSSSHTNRLN